MVLKGLDALLFLANDIYWDMGYANLRYLTQCGSKIGSYGLFFHDRDPIVWNAVAHIRKPAERAGLDFVELGWHAMGLASPVVGTGEAETCIGVPRELPELYG